MRKAVSAPARLDKTVPVGFHPQRIRNGFVRSDLVAGLPDYAPPAQ